VRLRANVVAFAALKYAKHLSKPEVLCLKKARNLTFDHNLGKYRSIFKSSFIDKDCSVYGTDFHLTSTALLHYLAKFTCSKLPTNFSELVSLREA